MKDANGLSWSGPPCVTIGLGCFKQSKYKTTRKNVHSKISQKEYTPKKSANTERRRNPNNHRRKARLVRAASVPFPGKSAGAPFLSAPARDQSQPFGLVCTM